MATIINKLTKDFTALPNALIQDDTLSDRARFLFVYMATKPSDWQFFQKPLCKGLAWSADTLRKYMAELIDAGWVSFQGQRLDKGKFTANQYTLHSFPTQEKTVSENFRHGKKPTLTKERPKQKKEGNKSIVGKPDSAPFHKEVIDYLNASTKSKYRPSTKATKRLVSARAKEGFTLDDFKQVIDTKTAEWKGTTSAKYLRPETLFGTKFESYLNQAASTTVANSDGILNDEQLTDSLQASYNKYIEFVQSECPELYRSECKVLTHSEYRKMAKLVDQPGAFKIPPQARQRLLKKAHIRLNTDEFMRRKYSNVYQLYKEAIRAELNFEKLPI